MCHTNRPSYMGLLPHVYNERGISISLPRWRHFILEPFLAENYNILRAQYLTFLLKKSLVFENTSLNGKWFLKVHLLSFPTPCIRKKSHGGFLRNSAKCKISEFGYIFLYFQCFFFCWFPSLEFIFEVFKWIFEA